MWGKQGVLLRKKERVINDIDKEEKTANLVLTRWATFEDCVTDYLIGAVTNKTVP